MKRAFAPLCLAAVFSFAACSTTAPPPTVEETFKKADMNGDGMVSRAEYDSLLIADMFQQFDKNGDGAITREEFLEGGGTAEGFDKINANSSGSITLEEAKSSDAVRRTLAAPFNEADANRDGRVTLEEFRTARAKALDYVR